MSSAACRGHMEVCRWLHAAGCPWGVGALAAAAGEGHLDLCEWLLDAGCPWEAGSLGAAARGGHVGILRWLLARQPTAVAALSRAEVTDILCDAARGCDIGEILRLHSQLVSADGHMTYGELIVRSAIQSTTSDWRAKADWLSGILGVGLKGELPVGLPIPDERIEWRWRLGPSEAYCAAFRAACDGDAATVSWLLAAGIEPDKRGTLCEWAASAGHVAVLEALLQGGVELDAAQVVLQAARAGHLHVVAWAVGNLGGGWEALTTQVFADAAATGSMQLLAWLRERGCPWDGEAYCGAARSGKVEVLEWLDAGGCPKGRAQSNPFLPAAANGDVATLSCLHLMDSQWQSAQYLECALSCRCRVHVLRWLYEPDCWYDWDNLARRATASLDDEVVLWVAQQRAERAASRKRMSARWRGREEW